MTDQHGSTANDEPIPFQQAQIVARAIGGISFDDWKAMESVQKEPYMVMARRAIRANRRYFERYAPEATSAVA